MTATDATPFRELFDDLVAIFGRRFNSDTEKTRCVAQYFDVLQAYSFDDVRRGFDRLREGDGFPKGPRAWRVAIPHSATKHLPWMTDAEMRESDDAESRGYEADPCRCVACREAGTTHQPPRYVPREDAAGELLRRRHPRTGEEKILGEWIHAERVRSWYTGRANFYEAFAKLKVKVMPKVEVENEEDPSRTVTV